MRICKPARRIPVLVGIVLLSSWLPASAEPIVWSGAPTTFTKPAFADWTLPENQDRLTANVWLTRGASLPLFNIALEPGYTKGSPADTEWAFGPTQPGHPGPIRATNHANLVFTSFVLSLDSAIGRNAVAYGPGVVHLISDDIYIDIKFTSWSPGQREDGVGFSYVRSTPGSAPVPEPASATLVVIGAVAGVVSRRRSTQSATRLAV